MFHDSIHAVTPLMWVGIFSLAIMLRHHRKMAQIAQDGQDGLTMRAYAAPRTATPPDHEIAALRDR